MNVQIAKLIPALTITLTLGACASLENMKVEPPPSYGDQYLQVHPGLTQDEVRGIAGTPTRVAGVSDTGGPEWTYRFEDPSGFHSEFDVTFGADGRVSDSALYRLAY
jgi:outer membrane protein assembly factor BamE (lipoprotein component of BamABCDE complex)